MKKTAIIIPVGPKHLDIYESRALRCAHTQTVDCKVVVVKDKDGRGPGWARNQGVEKAGEGIDFLVFLDADDEISPEFVEKCIDTWRPDTYVYTDWKMGNRYEFARPAGEIYCFCGRPIGTTGKNFHPVTTLIPYTWFRSVGGFDESLVDGGEDKALYVALNMSGCCGIRLPEALFGYHHTENSRGQLWTRDNAKTKRLHDQLFKEYGGIMSPCRSCGGSKKPRRNTDAQIELMSEAGVWGKPGSTIDLRIPGDGVRKVLFNCKAQCRARSYRSTTGRVTRFNYATEYNRRVQYPDIIWMDARDAKADPALWQIIEELPDQIFKSEPASTQPVEHAPDYDTLISAGQHALNSGGVFR